MLVSSSLPWNFRGSGSLAENVALLAAASAILMLRTGGSWGLQSTLVTSLESSVVDSIRSICEYCSPFSS